MCLLASHRLRILPIFFNVWHVHSGRAWGLGRSPSRGNVCAGWPSPCRIAWNYRRITRELRPLVLKRIRRVVERCQWKHPSRGVAGSAERKFVRRFTRADLLLECDSRGYESAAGQGPCHPMAACRCQLPRVRHTSCPVATCVRSAIDGGHSISPTNHWAQRRIAPLPPGALARELASRASMRSM